MSQSELIEQAVFTSAVTERAAGYQIVATSPGVCEEDARELAVWGPSHDALLDSTPSAVSINFHPLPSGAFCVSRTTPSGWEYSGRGGARVYTQCLLMPPAVLARFANNPFAVLRAALAGGAVRVYEDVPPRLEPFRLLGRASAVDAELLARAASQPGHEWMASLIQAMLDSTTLAVAGGPPAEHLIAAVVNCLPPECRKAVSFSTGLRYSSRRPFRIVALSDDAEEQRRVQRVYHATVVRLTDPRPADFHPVDSWPRLIQQALKESGSPFLVAQLSKRHLDAKLEELSALGLQLLEEFDASRLHSASQDHVALDQSEATPAASPMAAPAAPQKPALEVAGSHAAHARFEKSAASRAIAPPVAPPSHRLETTSAAVRRRLKQLDDLVYRAVSGNLDALEQLKSLWPKIREELGDHLLARSREAYLRYALAIWEECLDAQGLRDPEVAIQSLDVLCVLFDEA